MGAAAEIGSNLLLFGLVFGMSATVDTANLRKQLGNRNALLTGIFLQFVVLPFLGFAVVKALNMSSAMGITLLVVTSSPGGSYSNWWCSMFNADLALSVTMTAISTLMSIIMLPVNLVIYATSSYSSAVVKSLDWASLFISLIVVIGAIGMGLFCSAKIHSHKFNLFANKMGNLAGISLVVYSVLVSSSNKDAELWDRGWKFYLGVAAPCVLGLVVANIMTSFFKLFKPERVTVSVECCYQNVGIATSVAITMFDGDELAEAIGVPLFYGLVEAIVLGVYCIAAWKIGWTKAPKDENLCVVVFASYEVEEAEIHDVDAIEVVLGVPKDGLPSDLIFQFDEEEGYTIDEGSLMTVSHPPTPETPACKSPDELKNAVEDPESELDPVRLSVRLETILSSEEPCDSPEKSPPPTDKGAPNEIPDLKSIDSAGEASVASPVEMNGNYSRLQPATPEGVAPNVVACETENIPVVPFVAWQPDEVTPERSASEAESRGKGQGSYSKILLSPRTRMLSPTPENRSVKSDVDEPSHALSPDQSHSSAPGRLGRAVASIPRGRFSGKSPRYQKAVSLGEEDCDNDQPEAFHNELVADDADNGRDYTHKSKSDGHHTPPPSPGQPPIPEASGGTPSDGHTID